MRYIDTIIYYDQLSLIKKWGVVFLFITSILCINYYALLNLSISSYKQAILLGADYQRQYKLRYAHYQTIKQLQESKKHLGLRLKNKLKSYTHPPKPLTWIEQLLQQAQAQHIVITNAQPLKPQAQQNNYFEPIKISMQGMYINLLRWLQQQNRSNLVIELNPIQIKRVTTKQALNMEVILNVYAKK